MQNRKDLLQAHRLMTQRAALALICGEPDSPNQPLRRLNVGTISGVLVGVVLAGTFAVLGLLSPGHATGLTQPGTLVIDKDTAAPYVPCESRKLCPALNYASALLALDTANVNKVEVSQASLSRYPIGPTIGISGLPQDLPTSGDLVRGPWSVCEQLVTNGPGFQQPQSTLVGGQTVGGAPLGTASGALVTTSQGSDWVLWNGERLLIQQQVMLSLFAGAQAQDVPIAWLDAVPQGPDFAAPAIRGQGQVVAGPAGGLVPVGQVFFSDGDSARLQDFVMLANGQLASVSATQAALLEREPGAPGPRAIAPSAVTSHLSGTPIPDDGLPVGIPKLAATTSPLCITYSPGPDRQFTVGGNIPSGAIATGATGGTDVDQVWLPPGHGALIGALGSAPSAGQPSLAATYFLLTGAARYALSSRQVAQVLGYNLTSQATTLPASVLDLVPPGPAMDPASATRQARL